MLRRVDDDAPYDWEDDPDFEERRQRMTFVCALVALGALAGGLALGFLIDWVQGRIL